MEKGDRPGNLAKVGPATAKQTGLALPAMLSAPPVQCVGACVVDWLAMFVYLPQCSI